MKSDAEREIDHLVLLKPEMADIMQLPIYCVSKAAPGHQYACSEMQRNGKESFGPQCFEGETALPSCLSNRKYIYETIV